jgi:predicted anti-sigma-YlaC factor YlaD
LLTCRRVSELVSFAQDRRLSWLERWRLKAHLRVCQGCRNFERQMSFLRRAITKHPALRGEDEERP